MEDRRPERPWQVAVAFLSGAAGLGLFLVGLGAAVMWVRLDAVGLPAERGVGLISKQSLAIVGFHVLIEPVLLQAAIVVLFSTAGFLLAARRNRDGVDAAENAGSAAGRSSSIVAATDHILRLRTIAILLLFLILALPFEWGGMTAALAIPALLLVVGETRALLLRKEVSESLGISVMLVAMIITAGITGLATEGDKPSYLQLATVRLKDEGERHGYFISEDADNVYLGDHGAIVSYPHEALRSVTVRSAAKAKPFHGPRPLAWRLYDLILR